jgi:sterol 3beta-glucosyltransferase
LIQALQAIPWEDDADNVDDLQNPLPAGPHPPPPLTSSIHTIYRPIARSRKNTPATAGLGREASSYFPEIPTTLPPETEEEDDSDPDFEHTERSRSPRAVTPITTESVATPQSAACGRSLSLATVRVTRRTRLAFKLKEIFEIEDITEVLAGTFVVCCALSLGPSEAANRDSLLVITIHPSVHLNLTFI